MQFFNSLAFTAISFVAFTALVAVISWWKTRGDNLDTQDGYYLAGRGLTGPVIAGSLLMTNLSAEQLVGNNGSRRYEYDGLGSYFRNRAGYFGLRADAEVPQDRLDDYSAVFRAAL